MYNQIKRIYNEIFTRARIDNAIIGHIYINMDFESGNFTASAMIGGESYRLGFDINNEFYFNREETKDNGN